MLLKRGELMTNSALKPTERTALEDMIAHARDARLVRRACGVLWLNDGESADDIAERLGVSRQTVYNWAERFLGRAGLDLEARLADAERRGRPCTAQGIIDPLIEAVIDLDPHDFGYRSTVWTAPLLVRYLADTYKIVVSCQSVRLALARVRIRWKRPRHRLALRPDTWRQAKGGLNTGFSRVSARSS
jgi:transposase